MANRKPSVPMTKPTSYLPFDVFLSRMVKDQKLNPELLSEALGVETANRILDNANNWMGKPSLGRGTAVVLQGQLHSYAGAIDDVKARIAKHWEKVLAHQQPLTPTPAPKLSPKEEPTLKHWPPKPGR
ncbi:hypothetical protein [Legionella impletisoli]|uniref:Uncharacterized protein n=1 Tax=Legionella impletisoli TaxID=343510 RepID=A0A917NAK6_9GAMM|nr:hypothetical protein [Legionella impletisoli]GGI83737.1 hypothetical protein GCM10007966_10410 [Legionella impletisoli]